MSNQARRDKPFSQTRTVGTRVEIAVWKEIDVIARREDRTVSYIAGRLLKAALKAQARKLGGRTSVSTDHMGA
jgi:hypothetical protein